MREPRVTEQNFHAMALALTKHMIRSGFDDDGPHIVGAMKPEIDAVRLHDLQNDGKTLDLAAFHEKATRNARSCGASRASPSLL